MTRIVREEHRDQLLDALVHGAAMALQAGSDDWDFNALLQANYSDDEVLPKLMQWQEWPVYYREAYVAEYRANRARITKLRRKHGVAA